MNHNEFKEYNPTLIASTFAIRISQRTDQNCKRACLHRTLTDKINSPNHDRKEGRSANITYTQAGVSCFVGQESSKIKVQFFVGSSVVKDPTCV